MSLNDKIIKMALNSANEGFKDQLPMLNKVIESYGELKTKEARNFQTVLLDIADILKGTNMPIPPEMIEMYIKITAINIDTNTENQSKIRKFFNDLNKALKDSR